MNADHRSHAVESLRIEGPFRQRILEFQAFKFPPAGAAMIDLPQSSGSVRRDKSGQATVLHFAPGRFLLPGPASDMVEHFEHLQEAGIGALVDVEGKWRTFTLTGSGAERALASTVDLIRVLAGRDCAALYLFDCPAVLARRSHAFDLWVEASYAATLRECLDGLRPELVG